MKIKPFGQGVKPPLDLPDDSASTVHSSGVSGSTPPPVMPPPPAAGSAFARLVPPAAAFAAANLRSLIAKLDAAADTPLQERLNRLAAGPLPHFHELRQVLAGLEQMVRRGVESNWMRLEPWDPEEPMPALELLVQAGEALGLVRDPLAERLAACLVEGGMEELGAAHLGRKAAGVLQAVQWVWGWNGEPLTAGADPLLQIWEEQQQGMQRSIRAVREVLERHTGQLPPPLLRV